MAMAEAQKDEKLTRARRVAHPLSKMGQGGVPHRSTVDTVGKRRRGKRKRKRNKARLIGPKLAVTLDEVELAAGHDGFMRGSPEPALLFAAYGVSGERVALLDRAIRRVPVSGAFPTTSPLKTLRQRALFSSRIARHTERLLFVGVGIEEDAGDLVQSVYSELAAPDSLSVWLLDDLIPEPLLLAEAAQQIEVIPPTALRAQLLHPTLDWTQGWSDEWIGAAYLSVTLGEHTRTPWRMRFASSDRRNDWTAKLLVRA